MGDVVQTLPALTDAAKAIPDIRFDWAVDESFAEVPAWHAHVERVIPTALHRWGRWVRGGSNASQASQSGEIRRLLGLLRRQRYDFIVDVQGEFKSALIALLAKGPRSGYDRASAHEWGTQLTYNQRFLIPKGVHSIQRMRRLLAKALSYSYIEAQLDYGIDRTRLGPIPLSIPEPYVVFIHSTGWESKIWPETYWRQLVPKAVGAGFHVVLPWGSEAERERSLRIAAGEKKATILPKLSITQKASIISRAVATVGCDTGLSHIAAGLGVPSVTLYGATDPLLCGALGENQVHLASEFECIKCHEVKCSYGKPTEFKPACFVELTPEGVWMQLVDLMKESSDQPREIYELV
jgi:heptosyltransferase-1